MTTNQPVLQTERLIIREVLETDEKDFFEMDSNPEVHRYIDNDPVLHIEQIRDIIRMLRQQYTDNGIARWAVTDKHTGECLGWAGLKYFREPLNGHVDFYELGYRFKQRHWGRGLATEASQAILAYAFRHLPTDTIYAITHLENDRSRHVLHKLGFDLAGITDYMAQPVNWFELTREKWYSLQNDKRDLL